MPATSTTSPWTGFRSVSGRTLQDISDEKPTLLVFLRHAGCTFCREALADLHARLGEIEALGSQVAIVYQESPEGMRPLIEKNDLARVEQFSDPDRSLYEAFQLQLGRVRQLFNFKTLVRGFQAAITSGHGFGAVTSNVYQLPGAFLVHRGRVLREFRHQSASDRPNYSEMACPI
ncbi:AhpC/TSA family protein [Caulifigura coniformis]|uniref:AhpC/TSA family protein n=1 Tax=Caulifigura coniformis TaxID=2527983 RepID=A0A517SF05_9PLAN|nr:peroxiredoxin-like family protein [Caulifigura coniformis]QDT54688.1 AhpC/TSA family protein [Caulifigura coniformis]